MVYRKVHAEIRSHTVDKMITSKRRLCIVAATPLTIHFFFKQHISCCCKDYDVTVVYNTFSDRYLPPLGLPINEKSVQIERKVSPYKDLVALIQLCLFMRRAQFDMVITVVPKAGILGMLAAFFTNVRIRVHVFQGEVWASRGGALRAFLRFCDVFTTRLATNLLAVSPSERNFLEQEGVVRSGRIQVIKMDPSVAWTPTALSRMSRQDKMYVPNSGLNPAT
jgi:hypothetical protein